jgi:hypothetical protein
MIGGWDQAFPRGRVFMPAGGRRISAGEGPAVQARPTADSTSPTVRGMQVGWT